MDKGIEDRGHLILTSSIPLPFGETVFAKKYHMKLTTSQHMEWALIKIKAICILGFPFSLS